MSFDSATLPKEQQFATWARFPAHYDVQTDLPENGFLAIASAWQVGSLLVTHNHLGPVRMRRTKAKVRSDSIDHYGLIILLDGHWSGDLDGRLVDVGTDDFCMFDLTRPMETRSEASTSIILNMPRMMLDEVLPPFDIHGLVMGAGAGRLFSDYMKALVVNLPEIDAADAETVAKATRDHLALTLATARRRSAQPPNPAILSKAKRHIAANLKADLSAGCISAAIKTSRSSLYRAFDELGGVTAYVQRKRLEKAYSILSTPNEHRTTAEIAFEVGFSNAAHFYRQFRKQFGYTAGDLRTNKDSAEYRQPAPDSASDLATHEAFGQWDRRLR